MRAEVMAYLTDYGSLSSEKGDSSKKPSQSPLTAMLTAQSYEGTEAGNSFGLNANLADIISAPMFGDLLGLV